MYTKIVKNVVKTVCFFQFVVIVSMHDQGIENAKSLVRNNVRYIQNCYQAGQISTEDRNALRKNLMIEISYDVNQNALAQLLYQMAQRHLQGKPLLKS